MNYRHAFHAGGFADVFKHAVLTRILIHLAKKPAAFRVIDTHAGAGLYDLSAPEASRTGEWRDGIARLLGATLPKPVNELLAPYLTVIAACNRANRLDAYPGSPAIERALLRPHDRLIACEIEPAALHALSRTLRGDARAKVVGIDGWTAVTAYVPPKEKRGLVSIDPAFEQTDEFDTLAEKFVAAHRKWPAGIYLLWYPIKGRGGPDVLARRVIFSGIAKIVRAELSVSAPSSDRLSACGILVANPPWTLESELRVMLPALADKLGRDGKGAFRLDWLAPAR
jgi:23S rRNA (adenine2030-N6)-methyltransferase